MQPLVFAFEGLGLGPYLRSPYLQEELLPQLTKDVEVQVFSWMQNPTPPPNRKLIVIGHSFGGAAVCGRNYEADLVVTIDPRWTGFDSFSVPPAAKSWLNYYQRNLFFFPGCYVTGAANFLVTGYSHPNMPSYPPILKNILTALAST
jgi:hypothetical protein